MESFGLGTEFLWFKRKRRLKSPCMLVLHAGFLGFHIEAFRGDAVWKSLPSSLPRYKPQGRSGLANAGKELGQACRDTCLPACPHGMFSGTREALYAQFLRPGLPKIRDTSLGFL